MTWQTLRTLTAQVAEGTSAPTAETLVAVDDTQRFTVDAGRVGHLEVAFGALTWGGTTAASAATLAVWRSADGKVQRVGSLTVEAAGPAPAPSTVDLHGEQVWVTVESFAGGSAPTLAGDIYVRPVRAVERSARTAGTVRHATTPAKSDGDIGPIEASKRGIAFVGATLRHSRRLSIATAAGAWTGFASLAEGMCDALRTDTDSLIVYAQPPERDPLLLQTAAAWGSAAPPAGWAFVGTVATHTNGGGTTALTQDTATTHASDPLISAEYYAVIYTISGYVSGTLTPKIGTAAGTARSANGTYIEILQASGGTVTQVSLTPSNDFAGSVDVAGVWAIPGTPPLASGTWEPQSAVKVVACAASSAPGTFVSSAKVFGGWYRRAGATELT